MEGILQKGGCDGGVLQVKFWLQTDDKVKNVHENRVVTKLE